ncbi:MAG: hypothetical protein RAK25_02220 [TACK group archaeon]|nr:hypothetical protein [TACK group archaeon]
MGKGENTNLFREVMYFNGLSKEDQLRVIDALEGDPHTLNALVNIGWAPESFSNLDSEVQKRLLVLAKDNEKLARRLNLGAAFARAGPDVKALMIDCLNNDELRAAFAFQLGLNSADLTDEAFDDASQLILSNERMTLMFAYGAGAASLTLQESVLQKLISLAESNHVFARNYGRSFVQSIRNSNSLDSPAKLSSVELILKNAKGELADAICDEISKDPTALPAIAAQLSGNDELVSKLALQLSKNIKNYRGSKQEALIQSLISNSSLALAFCSSAYGLGLNLIRELKDDKLESLLRSSPAFAACLGAHTGKELNGLNRKERRKIIEMAKRSPALASGLADGIKECKEVLSNDAKADIDELAARSEDFRRRLTS